MTEANKELSIYEKLAIVQSELKAPKTNNPNVKYKSRSCEDILESAKPILLSQRLLIVMSEVVEKVGDRQYIKSTCTLIDLDSEKTLKTSTMAGEGPKGNYNDESQATGKAISYARKYCLGGMLAIDDTKDADTIPAEIHKENNTPPPQPPKTDRAKELVAEIEAVKQHVSPERLVELQVLRDSKKRKDYIKLGEITIKEAGFAINEAKEK